jgi:hypothetical protein
MKLLETLWARRKRSSEAAEPAIEPSSGFPTRRQWFAGAAGAAIGGTALAADAALRPASALAQSSLYVDLTSDQTIGGVKTFTQAPVVPAGTFALPQVPGTAMVAANVSGPFAPSSPGATAATRYVGGTASGPPSAGTFAVGDFVVDHTGKMWICTVAGTPGTWAGHAGGGVDLVTDQSISGVKTFTAPPVVPEAAFPQTAVVGLVPDLASKQPLIEPGTFVPASGPYAGALSRAQASADDYPVLIDVTPYDGAGPFRWTLGTTSFNGRPDHTMVWGYNVAYHGAASQPTEPVLYYGMEHDYDDGSTRWIETYIDYQGIDRTKTARPIGFSVDRTSHRIQGAITTTDPFIFYHQEGGQRPIDITLKVARYDLRLGGFSFSRIGYDRSGAPYMGYNFSYDRTGLRYIHDSLGATAGIAFTDAGHITFYTASSADAATVASKKATLTNTGEFQIRRGMTSALGVTFFDSRYGIGMDAGDLNLVFPGSVGCRFRIDSVSGAVVSRFTANRVEFSPPVVLKATTAPSDASLNGNELAVWVRTTPGAAGPQFKGKDSNGAVYAVNLSRQSPLPDTSGSTLAGLEMEVNAVKERLRIMGVVSG